MALNDSHMLPERVRRMRQMDDVLTVEDIVLIEIEKIIDEMYQRAAMLHEELINETWLKEKLEARTGMETTVTAYAEKLLVEFIFGVEETALIDLSDVRKFLDKWLPAHLKYGLGCRMELVFNNSELNDVKLVNVLIWMKIPFLPSRVYDGTLHYDGSARYDAKRNYKMGVGVRIHCVVEDQKERIDNLAVETCRNVQYYNGKKIYDGTTKYNAMIRKDVIE